MNYILFELNFIVCVCVCLENICLLYTLSINRAILKKKKFPLFLLKIEYKMMYNCTKLILYCIIYNMLGIVNNIK